MYNILTYNDMSFITAALKYGPVRNLSVAVDKLIPSVTLKWNPPLSALPTETIEYLIRFKVDGSATWNQDEIVAGSNTTVVLTRESGLVPLVRYHFQVRARSGEDEGDCKEVSAFYGICIHPLPPTPTHPNTHTPTHPHPHTHTTIPTPTFTSSHT